MLNKEDEEEIKKYYEEVENVYCVFFCIVC